MFLRISQQLKLRKCVTASAIHKPDERVLLCACTIGRVVMVVGAGRGPLVAATLKAATEAQRLVRVYAIEKNANAIVT